MSFSLSGILHAIQPRPPYDPANPTNAQTHMELTGLGRQTAVFENDNYRISVGDNNSLNISNKHTGEVYGVSGDAQLTAQTGSGWLARALALHQHLKGVTTLQLDDGTKVTIQFADVNKPFAGHQQQVSTVTITNGNYGVQISGADGAHRGDLQIHEAKGWGGLLDAVVDDGASLRENAHGSGFTTVPTAPVDLGPVAHLYTVRSRDTLSSIAKAHGVSLRELVQANPQLANPDRISVGQALNLPQGSKAGTDRAVIVSAPAAPAAQAAPSPTASAPSTPRTIDYAAMYQKKGHAYRQDQVKSYSHYNEPIDRSAGRAAGNSRIWGDAPAETQRAAIDAIIKASKAAGLSTHETALVLAIASVESGFNPDAAAGTTSAAGLGQFVNRTGKAYGLDAHNRWNVDAQAKALVAHFKENQHLAKANGHGDDYIYKYHHDGPAGEYGGLAIARQKVMPLVSKYEAVLNAATR